MRGGMRGAVAALLGMGCAVVLLQLAGAPGRRTALVEELPPVIGELEQHINVEDSKAFLNDIRDKGLTGQTLHPYGDLNPFTHEPEAEDNPESVLRRAKTRAIVRTADQESQQEMADAQQAARDFMGSDAGCTHEETDQTDYSGEIAQTVSGGDCLPWQEAVDLKLYNITDDEAADAAALPADAVSNYCRNPFGQRIAAWCVLASAKTAVEEGQGIPEAEGENWEYCDIGRRCAVDVPILKAQPAAAAQQLKAAPATGAALKTPAAQQLKAVGAALKTPVAQQLKAVPAAAEVPADQLRAEVGQKLRGLGAGPVLAQHGRGMRGRAMANSNAHRAQHQLRSSIMARRAPNEDPHGHSSLSHKQQLAMVPAASSESKPSIYGSGGLSGKQARDLVGKDWFSADKQMLSMYDSGIDARLSSREARRQLDAIYGDTEPTY